MPYRTARSWKPWTSALCAQVMLLLSACTPQTQIVYRDQVVKEPVPTYVSLPSELTQDCPPAAPLPQTGKLTVLDLMNRLDSVELVLATCRQELTDIRQLQPYPTTKP